MSEVFVSPTGGRMEVSSPTVAIRMRARGWRPESEVEPGRPAPARAPRPAAPKPESTPADS